MTVLCGRLGWRDSTAKNADQECQNRNLFKFFWGLLNHYGRSLEQLDTLAMFFVVITFSLDSPQRIACSNLKARILRTLQS